MATTASANGKRPSPGEIQALTNWERQRKLGELQTQEREKQKRQAKEQQLRTNDRTFLENRSIRSNKQSLVDSITRLIKINERLEYLRPLRNLLESKANSDYLNKNFTKKLDDVIQVKLGINNSRQLTRSVIILALIEYLKTKELKRIPNASNAEKTNLTRKPGVATTNRAWSIEKKTPASSTNNPLRQLNETSGELITNIEKAKQQNSGR